MRTLCHLFEIYVCSRTLMNTQCSIHAQRYTESPSESILANVLQESKTTALARKYVRVEQVLETIYGLYMSMYAVACVRQRTQDWTGNIDSYTLIEY